MFLGCQQLGELAVSKSPVIERGVVLEQQGDLVRPGPESEVRESVLQVELVDIAQVAHVEHLEAVQEIEVRAQGHLFFGGVQVPLQTDLLEEDVHQLRLLTCRERRRPGKGGTAHRGLVYHRRRGTQARRAVT